jgi:membrane protein
VSSEQPRWRASLRAALANFHRDRCLDQAATIAFYALVSVGPCLYLLCLVLTKILGESEAKGAAFTGAASFFPAAVAATVMRLEESVALGKGLALIAIPGLLWTTSSAFASLEYAVNVAFRTSAARRFWGSRLKAFSGTVLAGTLLVTSVALTQAGKLLSLLEPEPDATRFLVGTIRASASRLLITFVAFTFLLKVLPRGRVSLRAAAVSAGCAMVLWEAARQIFGFVLERSPGYGVLTGSLAGVVAILLWVYTAAAVVLLGAEIAAVRNGNRSVKEPERARPRSGKPR